MGTLRREETLSLSCACLKNYPRIIKKRSRINQNGGQVILHNSGDKTKSN